MTALAYTLAYARMGSHVLPLQPDAILLEIDLKLALQRTSKRLR